MILDCYIPDEKIRNLRDLLRRRHYFVNTRKPYSKTRYMLKQETDRLLVIVVTQIYSLKKEENICVYLVCDCLDTIELLRGKEEPLAPYWILSMKLKQEHLV